MAGGKISFGIIGTNFISDWFVSATKRTECATVSAVYSRTKERGEAFAKSNSIEKVYTSLSEMLSDDEIDAVYVASPTFLHKEHTISALRAGKHVLCEKMIAIDCGELSEMTRAAKKAGKVLLEAMRPDFDGAVELIRAELDKIGPVRRVSLDYCQYSSRYDKFKSGEVLNAFNPKMKNSALADIGIYPLHTCINLFGEPSSVAARSIFLENGFEAAGSVVMSYPGMLATVNYSKITDNASPSVIEGERGTILIDRINGTDNITVKLRTGESFRLDYRACPNNMHLEVIAFCDMIQGRASNEYYLSVSEKTMRCVEKIYASSGIKF
ncbi:MAG: Gfo/Idh/MocA family oxidoreductase [Clostridia bacterium]|nr:Gfo/Idh/MocA family oxidoreductase [Clostridia bacterium]